MRRSRASAPTGRDSIAQGASALGRIADEIVLAPTGRDRFPGLAPWAIESRPIRGCRAESGSRIGIRFDDPNVRVYSTSGAATAAVLLLTCILALSARAEKAPDKPDPQQPASGKPPTATPTGDRTPEPAEKAAPA